MRCDRKTWTPWRYGRRSSKQRSSNGGGFFRWGLMGEFLGGFFGMSFCKNDFERVCIL